MENEIAAINSCAWLYLNEIGEPCDNELRIVLHEAVSGSAANAQDVADESDPVLKKLLEGARPIINEKGCRIFELIWPSYIAYSIRNESYTSKDDSEKFTGRLFVEYSVSKYLDFVSAATFADQSYPGPFKHYGVCCLNHIVDVVSTFPPQIKVSLCA